MFLSQEKACCSRRGAWCSRPEVACFSRCKRRVLAAEGRGVAAQKKRVLAAVTGVMKPPGVGQRYWQVGARLLIFLEPGISFLSGAFGEALGNMLGSHIGGVMAMG